MDQFKEDLLQGENLDLMKKVSKLNKTLKNRFDKEVLFKQNKGQELKELYKPITDTQSEQINKTDNLFQQLLNDLQGKHDRTSRLLGDLIRGLVRSNETIRKQGLDIVSAISKQPLMSELINEVNNYPKLVKKIIHSEDLSEEDRKILEPLSPLNDDDLRTLVNYYVLKQKIEPEEDLDVPSYSDSVFQEQSIDSKTYKEVMTSLKKRKPGLNKKGKYGVVTVSPTFYYEENDPDTVKFGKYNVLFKDDQIKLGDKEYVLTQGLELLLNRVDPTFDERITNEDLNNYLNITLDAGFDYRKHITVGKKLHTVLEKLNRLDELQKDVEVMGNGYKTIILPDNVLELKNRLTLLLGEYSSGNKSMFNEINVILDILLKRKVINKKKYKEILCQINDININSCIL